jgi:O-antigen ligase
MERGSIAVVGIFFLFLCLKPSWMDAAFFIASAFICFLAWKEKDLRRSFLDPAFVCLLLFILLSLFNLLLYNAGSWNALVKLCRWIPAFLLGYLFIRKYPHHLAPALLQGAGFITLLFAGAMLLYAFGIEQINGAPITPQQPELTFINVSRAALYISLAAFVLFCCFLEKPASRKFSLPAVLFLGGILVLAGRRVSLAGFLICSGLILAARKKFVTLLFAFIVAAGGIMALNQSDRFNISPSHLASSQGVTERQSVWYAAWKVFEENPILGGGVGTFGEKSEPFVQEWFVRHPQYQRHETLVTAHNMIFHSLAENGLAGTLLLLSIFAGAALSTWKVRKTIPGSLCLCGCLGVAFIHFQLQMHTGSNVGTLIFLLLGMARGLTSWEHRQDIPERTGLKHP